MKTGKGVVKKYFSSTEINYLNKATTLKEKDELFVHLCDYIASRKFLNVNFENDEIADKCKEKK